MKNILEVSIGGEADKEGFLPAPKELQDQMKSQGDELEEINLAGEQEDPRPLFLSKRLNKEMRRKMIDLLKEYTDIFAWTYEEMPGLATNLITHRLNVASNASPVKQKPRILRQETELQVKAEIEKLLKAGFIQAIQHPTWLANIVPVKKKNGQVRICVDFRDLNKSCPKDDFPLPNIDVLIDATAGHEMFSFMDGYSGYNQIKMAKEDAEKTAFRTPIGNFYYTVMPFGLKNAGATYQRAMTTIFHDMLHDFMEDYVDDIVVKSKKENQHLDHLRKVFERCRLYQMKMNPLKCAFGVSMGKFLGFVVHRKGIDVDPSKTKAIQEMPPPCNLKQLKGFLGRLSYIRRFIPALSELILPFTPLLKKGASFGWRQEQQAAFQKVKEVLMSPVTMTMPVKGLPMKLYLTSTKFSIGALIVQEVEGHEHPVYYLSRSTRGAESKYSPIERQCLSLVFAAQKLRHYFLAHKVELVSKSDPIRYLLSRPMQTGRIAKWLLLLEEFDITMVNPSTIKSQALADLLAQFPSQHDGNILEDAIHEEIPGEFHEESLHIDSKQGEWKLFFDGSATSSAGGAGIVLVSPSQEVISIAYKLNFPCTNNESEYEALVLALLAAKEVGAKTLLIQGDSNLVIKQLNGEFALKEQSLATYRSAVRDLLIDFQSVKFEHVPRTSNRHADALATLASKIPIEQDDDNIDVTITKRSLPVTSLELLRKEIFEEDDWRKPIRQQLQQPQDSPMKILKSFILMEDIIYHRGADGVLSRCLSVKQGREKLEQTHEQWCGEEGPALYRLLQRAGYYWPSMAKDAAEIQTSCLRCNERTDVMESHFVEEKGDWRLFYIEFLQTGKLPPEKKDAVVVKRKAKRFILQGGELYRLSFQGKLLRCLSEADYQEALREAHKGDCGEHQGGRRLYGKLIDLGYYWPTMEKDAYNYVQRCKPCQMHGDIIHSPPVELHSLITPWPFHTWALDFIGPISPPSHGHVWILTATECFTKWVEAISMKKATGQTVTSFIKENIICRFGIPRRILSDNGTPFVNEKVRELLSLYEIDHVKSTPYYPKGNGQAEATNKTLIRVLGRMVHEDPKTWHEKLPMALWAYRTSRRGPTKATPFSLVYGAEAVLPSEIRIPSARMQVGNEDNDDTGRQQDLEALDERRDTARKNIIAYQRSLSKAYDKLVRPRVFKEGDMVLRVADHIRKGISAPKFTPKWEGPFVIHDVNASGYCRLLNPRTGNVTAPINFSYIKKYYI